MKVSSRLVLQLAPEIHAAGPEAKTFSSSGVPVQLWIAAQTA
jgi:hypothetical protein